MSNPRTFKQFSRAIELRAYIPNTLVGNILAITCDVAREMRTAFLPASVRVDPEAIQIASNRAGLHLAFVFTPTDDSNQYDGLHRKDDNIKQYEAAVKSLEAAGWTACKGS